MYTKEGALWIRHECMRAVGTLDVGFITALSPNGVETRLCKHSRLYKQNIDIVASRTARTTRIRIG